METGGSLKAVKVIPGESRRHAPGVFSPCARLGLHVSLDVKAAQTSAAVSRVCSAFIFLPPRSFEP